MKKALIAIVGILVVLVLSAVPVSAQGAFFGGLLGGMLGSSSGDRAEGAIATGASVLYRLPELEKRAQNPMGIMVTAVACSFKRAEEGYGNTGCSGLPFWEIFRLGQPKPEQDEILEIRIAPPDQSTSSGQSTKATLWFFYAKKDDVSALAPQRNRK